MTDRHVSLHWSPVVLLLCHKNFWPALKQKERTTTGTTSISSMPNRGRKAQQWSEHSPIVPASQWKEFEERSLAALKAEKIEPSPQHHNVFGHKFFKASKNSDQISYYAKLRGFVQFILKYKEYDDCLPILYPFTPENSATASDIAASHFMLYMMTKKGFVVKNAQVCVFIASPLCCCLFSAFFCSDQLHDMSQNPISISDPNISLCTEYIGICTIYVFDRNILI